MVDNCLEYQAESGTTKQAQFDDLSVSAGCRQCGAVVNLGALDPAVNALPISRLALERSDEPRCEIIAHELAHAIRHGELATGEKLPTQRELARQLGVTKGTVSQAYAKLEQMGLALARVGDGTYVRAVPRAPDPPSAVRSPRVVDMAQNIAIPTAAGAAMRQTLAQLATPGSAVAELLQYQPEPGMRRHREAAACWLRRFGTGGDWNRVMLTHGAQHALGLVLRTFARPGDVLLTENLTYPGLISLARSLRLQLVGVECDHEGLRPDSLEAATRLYGASLMFCTPSLHNPTGSTMSEARRAAVAGVARRLRLLVIEDAVQAALMVQAPPALASWLPDRTFLVTSFSKAVSPGLRVGLLECCPAALDKLAATLRNDCWMVAPLMAELVSRWLADGEMDRLAALQRASISERLARVGRHGLPLDRPANPELPHLYLPLPAGLAANRFATLLREAGVLVRTMAFFAAGRGPVPQALRLSLNSPQSAADAARGMTVVSRQLALARQTD